LWKWAPLRRSLPARADEVDKPLLFATRDVKDDAAKAIKVMVF
jgi:hypothetical protein